MTPLLYWHPILAFALIALASLGISALGVVLIRRRIPHEVLRENHELAAVIFNAFGLVYAVLIAFVVFVSWSSFDTTQSNLSMEVNKLTDLFADAMAFPESTRNGIRHAIADYTTVVIAEDWPAMADGRRAPVNEINALRRIWSSYISIDGRSINSPQMYSESLRQLNRMSEYRRLRWLAAKHHVPEVIWIILIGGAITSTVYGFFFGSRHVGAQVAMTGMLTAFNATILLLIDILDNPFVGFSAINNEPFQNALEIFIRVLAR